MAITVHAVVLFSLWKWPSSSYDWGPLIDRFVTSPAMAGLFAVIAAVIGAWSLNRQLKHTKQKTEDDAWWEQFEWVTDRIVSSGEEDADKDAKATERLPKSLAYNLMTALSKSARADFQNAAVAGIFEHFFRDAPSLERDGSETSDGPRMDATEAESLRTLLSVLPEDSHSSRTARRALYSYDYEENVQRALRDSFESVHSNFSLADPRADALIESGSCKLLVEVKLSVTGILPLVNTGNRLHELKNQIGASGAVIITRPPALKAHTGKAKELIRDLSIQGVHLVEWDPAEGSRALQQKITAFFPDISS
ncbi:hypothetical protein [Arthrobacter sp. TS-15]|uniref:hypothetical protein n=1 Tax=Arthrobacter sp. TS-15 TaxID=2510797 RepID=UPI001EE842DC|nr:hypothetical protein [Arthrobacter sp. TS-15]